MVFWIKEGKWKALECCNESHVFFGLKMILKLYKYFLIIVLMMKLFTLDVRVEALVLDLCRFRKFQLEEERR